MVAAAPSPGARPPNLEAIAQRAEEETAITTAVGARERKRARSNGEPAPLLVNSKIFVSVRESDIKNSVDKRTSLVAA